jgi:hypothetical protein
LAQGVIDNASKWHQEQRNTSMEPAPLKASYQAKNSKA